MPDSVSPRRTTGRSPAHIPPEAKATKRASMTKPRYRVQSLVGGLRILEALAKCGEPRGVTDLAREMGATKWVIFRHLYTLCSEGFVIQDPVTEKYEVGPRLHALREILPSRFAWGHKAYDDMLRLRQEVGFTVAIAAPLEDESGVVVLDVQSGIQNVQHTLKVGAVFDFHAAAHGKLALAFGPQELFDRVTARALRVRTPKTVVSVDALRHEIAKVRKRGWAIAPEESDLGMNALTAPIFSNQRKFVGSIGVFGSLEQVSATPSAALVRAVIQAANRISQRLGGCHTTP